MSAALKTWLAAGAAFAAGVALTAFSLSLRSENYSAARISPNAHAASKAADVGTLASPSTVPARAWSDPDKPVVETKHTQVSVPQPSKPSLVFNDSAYPGGAKEPRDLASGLSQAITSLPRLERERLAAEDDVGKREKASLLQSPGARRVVVGTGAVRNEPQQVDRHQGERQRLQGNVPAKLQADGSKDVFRSAAVRVPSTKLREAVDDGIGPTERRTTDRKQARPNVRHRYATSADEGYRTASYPQRGYVYADLSRYSDEANTNSGRRSENQAASQQSGVMRWLQEPSRRN